MVPSWSYRGRPIGVGQLKWVESSVRIFGEVRYWVLSTVMKGLPDGYRGYSADEKPSTCVISCKATETIF